MDMLTSEATLGYLMHDGRPVTREVTDPETGEKRMERVAIAPALWDAATRSTGQEAHAEEDLSPRAEAGWTADDRPRVLR